MHHDVIPIATSSPGGRHWFIHETLDCGCPVILTEQASRISYFRAVVHASASESGTCRDTTPALSAIIATVRAERGRFARHFLGPMCLFRQPRPDPAVRRPNPRLAWPRPGSACQHGL